MLRCCLLLGAILLWPLSAAGQPLREAPAAAKEDAAMQHFQLGLKFYRAGDYARRARRV